MSTQSSVKTGSCLCGKITYRFEGDSATPLYNTVCHCLNCRKWLGSAFLTASICPKSGFSITSGEDNLRRYTDDKTNSGKPLTRTFCGECGSSLFAFTPLREGIVSVAAGTLDDFENWQPDREQWCIHRAAFLEKVKSVEKQNRHTMSVQSQPEKE